MPYNTKKINIAYKSKNNLTHKRQIILLMINDGQKWHYLVVKNLSGLLRGKTSNHKEDFYCLNCFHSYRTENKLESHKKTCENHDYCHVEMPTKEYYKIQSWRKIYESTFYYIRGFRMFTRKNERLYK